MSLTMNVPDNIAAVEEAVPVPLPDRVTPSVPAPVKVNETAPPGLTVPDIVPLSPAVWTGVPHATSAVPLRGPEKLPPDVASELSEG